MCVRKEFCLGTVKVDPDYTFPLAGLSSGLPFHRFPGTLTVLRPEFTKTLNVLRAERLRAKVKPLSVRKKKGPLGPSRNQRASINDFGTLILN